MSQARVRGSGKYKKKKLVELAGNSVLLVGCGEGKYMQFCLSNGKNAVGIDLSVECAAAASKRTSGKALVADAGMLPFHDDSFDTVTLWDVLEHLQDDCNGLKEAIRVARRNVLFSVPSEDILPDYSSGVTYRTYSDLSHIRYYNRQRLESLISICGQKNYSIEMFDRIRPALMYRRVGVPRFLLSILDKMLWLVSSRSDKFRRNFFVEIRLNGGLQDSHEPA